MTELIDQIVSITDADILFNYIPSQEKDAKIIERKDKLRILKFGQKQPKFSLSLAWANR